jgi:hypothetical protein
MHRRKEFKSKSLEAERDYNRTNGSKGMAFKVSTFFKCSIVPLSLTIYREKIKKGA